MVKLRTSEEDHQRALAEWLDMRKVAWFHPPNGGHRARTVAAKLKGQGVKAGVPDVIIITPPPARPGAVGTVLELKTETGRVRASQRLWLETFEACGWVALVGRGWVDAVEKLKGLGY